MNPTTAGIKLATALDSVLAGTHSLDQSALGLGGEGCPEGAHRARH